MTQPVHFRQSLLIALLTGAQAVLPALVPELTYEGMIVANGQDAGLAWESGTGHKSGAAWLQERLGR